MNSVKYPIAAAAKLAKGIVERVEKPHRRLLFDSDFHNFDSLKGFAEEIGARIIFNKSLPGINSNSNLLRTTSAAVINVQGTPYILMDRSLKPKSELALRALAHEIAHVILGHLSHPNFAAFVYSGTKNRMDAELQELFSTQVELEADLLGMMLIVPDNLLEKQVDKTKFIPARRKARELGLDTRWLVARIQLYREIYGYKKSRELLKRDLSDKITKPDLDKWYRLEGTQYNSLEYFMPDIDVLLLGYLS